MALNIAAFEAISLSELEIFDAVLSAFPKTAEYIRKMQSKNVG